MKTRPYEHSDFTEVSDLVKRFQDFPVPDLSNPLYAASEVVLNYKNEIIAVGIVRITSEVILVIDKDKPIYERMQAIKKLISIGMERSKKLGLDEWHVFLTDPKFIKILEKLKFTRSKATMLFRGFYNG